MSRAVKSVKVIAYVLMTIALIRLVIIGASDRTADIKSMWLIVSALNAFWVLAWLEGVYLPLMLERKGHEKEFITIQVVTGLGIAGLCYLIATSF